MKDLNELQIFSVLAREMSFTRTAKALEISKAAVSRAISSLEERLATRLLERTTRRIRLTEAGEIYLIYAKRCGEGRSIQARNEWMLLILVNGSQIMEGLATVSQ